MYNLEDLALTELVVDRPGHRHERIYSAHQTRPDILSGFLVCGHRGLPVHDRIHDLDDQHAGVFPGPLRAAF